MGFIAAQAAASFSHGCGFAWPRAWLCSRVRVRAQARATQRAVAEKEMRAHLHDKHKARDNYVAQRAAEEADADTVRAVPSVSFGVESGPEPCIGWMLLAR